MQFSQQTIEQMISDPANADAIRESKELFETIMSRATTDREFRTQLVTDPKAAIAAQHRVSLGREIPSEALGMDIRFVEPKGEFTYVLPERVGVDAELSEHELSTVAGGATLLLTYCCGVAVALGVTWAVNKLSAPAPAPCPPPAR